MIIVSARAIDSRKDKKYSLTIPFWFDTVIEALICILAINFGVIFSVQIVSRRVEAAFWLSSSVFLGEVRCMMVGKNPSIVENDLVSEFRLSFRLYVILFSSIAMMKPRIVTPRAISFRCRGMVNVGLFMGVMLFEMMNPAKMLPKSSRLIEFVSCGLFSLMLMSGWNRGCPRRAKKMIRVLYAAVREVAMSVISRAQALVYDVLADSIIRSFE